MLCASDQCCCTLQLLLPACLQGEGSHIHEVHLLPSACHCDLGSISTGGRAAC